MSTKLTLRQRAVLALITERYRADGLPPSYDEIRRSLGLVSKATVHLHIHALLRKGALRHDGSRYRPLSPAEEPAIVRAVRLPLLGIAPASPPRPVHAVPGEEVEIPQDFIGPGEHFALRVSGDSMHEAGIHDGDLAVIRRQASAENGDVAAVLLNGETTLKTLRRKGRQAWLEAAGGRMQPIPLLADAEVEVQGVLVALLRRYRPS